MNLLGHPHLSFIIHCALCAQLNFIHLVHATIDSNIQIPHNFNFHIPNSGKWQSQRGGKWESRGDEEGEEKWEKIVYYWAAIGPEWIIRDFIRVITARNNLLRIVNGITGSLGAAALSTRQLAQESAFQGEDYIHGPSQKTLSLYRASQALGVTVGILGTIFDTFDFAVSWTCFIFSGTQSYFCGNYRIIDVFGSSLYMIGHIIIWAYPPSGTVIALIETYFTSIVWSILVKADWAQGNFGPANNN